MTSVEAGEDPVEARGVPGRGGPGRTRPAERPEALVITGPTATGKTVVGVAVAERLCGEIISMDSRQVYRGLDLGTAKPAPADRRRIPHHGLDLVEPTERFSAGRYARYAAARIREIRGRGRVPLLVGGSGFFLRALLSPIFREPEIDRRRRDALRERLSRLAVEELKRWLGRLDAERLRSLAGEGGRQRLLRSLELPLLTGRSHSVWVSVPPDVEPVRALVVVLWSKREELACRIDARVDAMIEAGLLHEVERLLERCPPDAPGFKTHGYMELIPVVLGERLLNEGVAAVKRDTRAYARRQVTWFRHQLSPGTVFLDASRPTEKLAGAIARYWLARTAGPRAAPAPSQAGGAP